MKTSDRYHKNYPVSWEQLQRDCRALAWKLLDKRKDWSRIVTVARGGLVPAAIIASSTPCRYDMHIKLHNEGAGAKIY